VSVALERDIGKCDQFFFCTLSDCLIFRVPVGRFDFSSGFSHEVSIFSHEVSIFLTSLSFVLTTSYPFSSLPSYVSLRALPLRLSLASIFEHRRIFLLA
jgi:hypothetical protein